MERALRPLVLQQVSIEFGENRTAVGKVRAVVLECRDARNGLAAQLERRHLVRDALLGLGNDAQDRLPHLLERRALRLGNSSEVCIDVT